MIKDDIKKAVEALQAIDRSVAVELDKFRAEVEESKLVGAEKHAHAIAEKDDEIKQLKEEHAEKLQEVEDALEFWGKVEAGKIGWLETDSIPKRLIFEKLRDRWEFITPDQLDAIEAILEGRTVWRAS